MQEGLFTKIGAVATVIGVIYAFFSPAPTERPPYDPVPKTIPDKNDFFNKNPLYTISAGSSLTIKQDVYLPAYQEIIYIQNGKFISNKNDIDENNYILILKLNRKIDQTRKIPLGKSFKIKDSSRHGNEDREYRHTYIYMEIDSDDIDYLKCLGKDNSDYITIGQFKNITAGIFDISIPNPKEI